jgi:hypothetical protein
MKKNFVHISALLGFGIVLLSFPMFIFAQESPRRTAISITPPLSEIVVQPGKTVTQAFTITNDGAQDLEVLPTIVPFSPYGESGEALVLSQQGTFEYAELQNLDIQLNSPFPLLAGKSQQLVLRINVPEDAVEQDHYQTFLLHTKPIGLAQLNGNNSVAQASIGVHILLSISTSGLDHGSIKLHKIVAPKIIDMFSGLTFQVFAKNSGKNYTKAHGEIKLRSMFGEVVKVFPILPENVLADSTRELHTSVPNPEDAKSAQAAAFEYRPLFLLGKYTISTSLYAEGQTPEEKETIVYALPISPFLVLLLFYGSRFILKKMTTK